jgi:Fe2+ or Zn2+ uptake regulation protein
MRMIRNRSSQRGPADYVLTPQRDLILASIKKSDKPVNAGELFRIVGKKDRTISLATVYRSLALFKKLGIINEHRLGKSCWCYEVKKSFEHQHILCRQCGEVIEFESPLITEMIKNLQAEQGFYIERVEVCIQGICCECQPTSGKIGIE